MDLALLKFERGPAYAAGGGERGDKLAEVLNDAGRWVERYLWWLGGQMATDWKQGDKLAGVRTGAGK